MRLPTKGQMWGMSSEICKPQSEIVKDSRGNTGIRTTLDPEDLEMLYICMCAIWRTDPLTKYHLDVVKRKMEDVFSLSWSLIGRNPYIFKMKNGLVVRELAAPTSGDYYASLYLVLESHMGETAGPETIEHLILNEGDCLCLLPNGVELPKCDASLGDGYEIVEQVGEYTIG